MDSGNWTLERHIKPEDILVIATHRPRVASKLANRVVVMHHGEIMLDGKPDVVIPQMMQRQAGRAARAAKNGALVKGNRGPVDVI